MITITWPPDLLRLGDLTCLSLGELLDLAARMKADAGGWGEALAGQPLVCAEEREIVVRRAHTDEPEPTLTAIAHMLQDAEDFHLFVHARSGQDVVVHWLGAGRIALLFPPRSTLADEATSSSRSRAGSPSHCPSRLHGGRWTCSPSARSTPAFCPSSTPATAAGRSSTCASTATAGSCSRAMTDNGRWRRHDNALMQELHFRDFEEAMRFMERVAEAAIDYARRPDMCVSEYNRVRLSIANPHHAPPTQAELRVAAKVDAIVDQHHGEAVA